MKNKRCLWFEINGTLVDINRRKVVVYTKRKVVSLNGLK